MQFYVKDIMTTDILTIKDNTSVRDAIKIFANNDISGMPVVDADNNLSGVLTLKDILQSESDYTFYYAPQKKEVNIELLEDSKFFDQPVSSIMSRELFTVKPDSTVAEMSKIMYENKIHRLLVTEYNKLLGIVTTFDVLKLLATSDEAFVL